MRNVSTLVGLSLVAMAATAHAQEPTPAAPPPPVSAPAASAATVSAPAAETVQEQTAAVSARKLQLGLLFLPMAHGKISSSAAGVTTTDDGSFAYGFGLLASYEIFRGFSLGVAPQVILNGKVKELPGKPAKQIDVLARLAYAYKIPDVVTLYAEVLPGYSLVAVSEGKAPKGPVVVVGVGASMDMGERAFVSFGAGYEKGFQKQTAVSDHKIDYIRVSLGGGYKF